MFTGIIEEIGKVLEVDRAGRIEILAGKVLKGTAEGDSIAVSGACLTVVGIGDNRFTADVMPETLRRTTLGSLESGDGVNLERAMAVGDRFGGHIVNGHVDGVGRIASRRPEANAVVFEIIADDEITRYMAAKGSVAVDGISLTVVEVSGGSFKVSIIPHTLEQTTLAEAGPGRRVNIEVDIIAKYVEALLGRGRGTGGLEDALRKSGFIQ